VRRETIRTLLEFTDQPRRADRIGDDSLRSLHRANCLLAAYIRHVLGREPRTLALLFGKRLPS
jgi:hypothetical protein